MMVAMIFDITAFMHKISFVLKGTRIHQEAHL